MCFHAVSTVDQLRTVIFLLCTTDRNLPLYRVQSSGSAQENPKNGIIIQQRGSCNFFSRPVAAMHASEIPAPLVRE